MHLSTELLVMQNSGRYDCEVVLSFQTKKYEKFPCIIYYTQNKVQYASTWDWLEIGSNLVVDCLTI